MPTVDGSLTWLTETRLRAVFVINGIRRIFSMEISPSVQSFTTSDVKLKYDTENQLTSTRVFQGVIGILNFHLQLGDGPVISGAIKAPGVNPATTVDGTGTWEEN
ncbi:uncharacterized protein FOMMEDRAFT_31134 [Fomitiporia mediterranea MF3/22]|uniref:uncharacterized protein n=1 Tax=Fomitiporia mediterranea (strain MF3/22) TaxID=694068 RepID=UPI0004409782|nr:uncharacterized protein FOMMEDRAFT_31134 [Fomitiporia mediterranea MF3/22]EJC99918.1 hypothetical protein FOMMEDRAFT_31134 [Fomitiporia mediterranea MF3/22]